MGLHVRVDPVDEVGGLCVHSWVAGLGAPEHAFYHTVFLLYFCVFVFACIFILFLTLNMLKF